MCSVLLAPAPINYPLLAPVGSIAATIQRMGTHKHMCSVLLAPAPLLPTVGTSWVDYSSMSSVLLAPAPI